MALRNGKYTHIPLSTVVSGIKRVDVQELYDRENYRPKVAHMLGKSIFLYQAGLEAAKHHGAARHIAAPFGFPSMYGYTLFDFLRGDTRLLDAFEHSA
jgi:hypothetical protein